MKDFRIIFMGTPDFAVASLDALIVAGFNVVAVVTSPDKPAGRGQQIAVSSIKKYAIDKGLKIFQPDNLKSPEFISDLQSVQPDLMVVVAFRMLPEAVWNIPLKGTINLHASILPDYRGAAPINHAIINGDKITGVTTFFISHEIDTGNIILQDTVNITDEMNAGLLHDILMKKGADLLVKTVKAIESGNFETIPQDEVIVSDKELKKAPKIFRNDCRIDWDQDVKKVYNHIRGLSPYPAAYTELIDKEGNVLSLRIYTTEMIEGRHDASPYEILTDEKTYIYITTEGGLISLLDVQLQGKKRMKTQEFLRGFRIRNYKIKPASSQLT